MPGIAVAERGPNYLVLRPQQRRRYGGDVAVLLGLAIVLAVLILTAVTPVLIVLLPLALLPGVPLLLDNRPDLAISAVADDLGGTRVTVHGQASSELAAALDAYLGRCRGSRWRTSGADRRAERSRSSASYFSRRITATTTPSRLSSWA